MRARRVHRTRARSVVRDFTPVASARRSRWKPGADLITHEPFPHLPPSSSSRPARICHANPVLGVAGARAVILSKGRRRRAAVIRPAILRFDNIESEYRKRRPRLVERLV